MFGYKLIKTSHVDRCIQEIQKLETRADEFGRKCKELLHDNAVLRTLVAEHKAEVERLRFSEDELKEFVKELTFQNADKSIEKEPTDEKDPLGYKSSLHIPADKTEPIRIRQTFPKYKLYD